MTSNFLEETWVSLDLETTGLSPERDEIIEVGAVVFNGNGILDSFHSLVNPGRPLSRHIQLLTGISPAELEKAPQPSPTLQRLISFIGDRPLIGHSLSFDLGFLSARGFGLNNRTCDTYELAGVLLPCLPDYSLTSIAMHLGIPHTTPHRALPDAIAVHQVFGALLSQVSLLSPMVLSEILNLGAATSWHLRPLFQKVADMLASPLHPTPASIESLLPEQEKVPTKDKAEKEKTPPPEVAGSLDPERLVPLLEPGGTLERSFPGFEHRPEQVRLMRAIVEAFNQSRHLVAEAGTGTGKSLAYLVPSLFHALDNKSHVVISTSTINLQEQLVNKDVPQLLGSLTPSPQLQVAQLKGRSNYLCPKLWDSLRLSPSLSADEVRLLARTLIWLGSTKSGDRSELNLSPGENRAWHRICASAETCLPECHHREAGRCFLHNARARAEQAHLIVVNHSLLLSDMVADNRLIPEFSHLIVDEGHHLEEEATRQLGFDLYSWEMEELLKPFVPTGGRKAGLLVELGELWAKSAPEARQRGNHLLQQLVAAAEATRGHLSSLWETLTSLVAHYSREQGNYERRLRLSVEVRKTPRWETAESLGERTRRALDEAADTISQTVSLLDGQPSTNPPRKGLIVELSSLYHSFSDVAKRLELMITSSQRERLVCWISLGGNQQIALHAAPLEVGPALEKALFSRKDCVVVTSATLTSSGSFDYIKKQLRLEDAAEIAVGSPFDHLHSTLVCLAQDVPEPDRPGYQEAVAQVLVELGTATQGRTLVLFTSYAALRTIYAAIRVPLEDRGLTVLGQGIDGSPRKLVDAFRNLPGGVLLGTSSLWEGIDIPGEALSVVVLPRLPFEVPTDPIFAARSELFEDSFSQYSLPQSVLRFKQGFGRLIRSKKDRGAMVVLDSRLHTRRYGSVFLRSLPPCTVKTMKARAIPPEVCHWLEACPRLPELPDNITA